MTPMSKEFLKAWHFHEEKATFLTAEIILPCYAYRKAICSRKKNASIVFILEIYTLQNPIEITLIVI